MIKYKLRNNAQIIVNLVIQNFYSAATVDCNVAGTRNDIPSRHIIMIRGRPIVLSIKTKRQTAHHNHALLKAKKTHGLNSCIVIRCISNR